MSASKQLERQWYWQLDFNKDEVQPVRGLATNRASTWLTTWLLVAFGVKGSLAAEAGLSKRQSRTKRQLVEAGLHLWFFVRTLTVTSGTSQR